MRKVLWFMVGLVYFFLVWGNRSGSDFSNGHYLYTQGLLSLGLVIWTSVIVFACRTTWTQEKLHILAPKVKRLAWSGLGALLIQFGLGFLSRLYHAGLSCPTFPLCSTSFLPSTLEAGISFSHRWWGILMLGLFAHLSLAAVRTAPELAVPARRAFALSVAQIFLGIGAVMSELNPDSRLVHVGVGYSLWGILIYLVVRTTGSRSQSKSDPKDFTPILAPIRS